jgi:hypothetical protein
MMISLQAGGITSTDAAGVLVLNPFGLLIGLTPASNVVPTAGRTGSVVTSAAGQLPWSASSDNSWITLTGNTSGSGNGSIDYLTAPNDPGLARVGTISISGRQFTLTQPGRICLPIIFN